MPLWRDSSFRRERCDALCSPFAEQLEHYRSQEAPALNGSSTKSAALNRYLFGS